MNSPVWECGKCGKMFVNRKLLEKHYKHNHAPVPVQSTFWSKRNGPLYQSKNGEKDNDKQE